MTKARQRYNAAVEKREQMEAAFSAHTKTYCRDTMDERRHFTIPFENGKGHFDCEGSNPNFDPNARRLYYSRLQELDRKLEKCKDEERRALLLLEVIEAPLNLIRLVRRLLKWFSSLCKRIEQVTRPE